MSAFVFVIIVAALWLLLGSFGFLNLFPLLPIAFAPFFRHVSLVARVASLGVPFVFLHRSSCHLIQFVSTLLDYVSTLANCLCAVLFCGLLHLSRLLHRFFCRFF